jgi:hypothetical protein
VLILTGDYDLKSILILSYNLRLGLPSGLFMQSLKQLRRTTGAVGDPDET